MTDTVQWRLSLKPSLAFPPVNFLQNVCPASHASRGDHLTAGQAHKRTGQLSKIALILTWPHRWGSPSSEGHHRETSHMPSKTIIWVRGESSSKA